MNIGTQNPQSINRLVELIGGEVDFIPKRPGEPDITQADISLAKKLISWEPEIDFEQGIKLVLSQIHLWKEAPLWESHNIAKATSSWFQYLGKNENY